jgi:hypothetical protein
MDDLLQGEIRKETSGVHPCCWTRRLCRQSLPAQACQSRATHVANPRKRRNIWVDNPRWSYDHSDHTLIGFFIPKHDLTVVFF